MNKLDLLNGIKTLPSSIARILDDARKAKREKVDLPPPSDYAPNLTQWDMPSDIVDKIHNPPPKGQRSETDFAVVCALIKAGATNTDIVDVFTYYPIGRQGKYGQSGAQYLAHTIGNARAKVGATNDVIKRLRAAREYWRGPKGIARLRDLGFRRAGDVAKTFDAIFETAIIRGTTKPVISHRQLGQASNNSHMTAKRHRDRLAEAGLLDLIVDDRGIAVNLAKAVEESDPTVTPPTYTKCVGVTVGSHSDTYADNRTSDAFTAYPRHFAAKRRHMDPGDLLPSLGGSGLLVWRALFDAGKAMTLAEIAAATGLSKAAVRAILKKLEAHELVVIWVGRPQLYELHPDGEYRLQEQIPHMTTYGVGKMREKRNSSARGDWCQHVLQGRTRLDTHERERLRARRDKYDQQAVDLANELEDMGIDLHCSVQERQSKPKVLKIDPAAEWERVAPVWDAYTDSEIADLAPAERRRTMIMAGWGADEIDDMLQMARRTGKVKREFILAPDPFAPVPAAGQGIDVPGRSGSNERAKGTQWAN